MAATTIITFKLTLLLSLLSASLLGVTSHTHQNARTIPQTCKFYECPTYDVIQVGNDYEIRRYDNPTVWVSTSPIQEKQILGATSVGYLRLIDYIYGKNKYKQEIEMTAPVITEALPSDGFVISFFVPKKNQENPPPAEGIHVQRWKNLYAAVRQFGGYAYNENVKVQVAALNASIAGTKWSVAVAKSHRASNASPYTVAQYNDPAELENRVNEIWFLFEM